MPNRCQFTVYIARPDLSPLNPDAYKALYNERHAVLVDCMEYAEGMEDGMACLPWRVGRGTYKFIAGFFEEPMTSVLVNCPTFPDVASADMQEDELKQILTSPGYIRMSYYDLSDQHYEREDCMFNAYNMLLVFMAMGLPGMYLPGAQICRGHSEVAQMAAHTNNRKKLMGMFTHHHVENPKEGEYWWHTHGMQHYALPDIECWFDDETNPQTLEKVVQIAMLDMIPRTDPIKKGEVLKGLDEYMGKYQFCPAEEEVEGHEFGPHGVQGIMKAGKKKKKKPKPKKETKAEEQAEGGGWKFWKKKK